MVPSVPPERQRARNTKHTGHEDGERLRLTAAPLSGLPPTVHLCVAADLRLLLVTPPAAGLQLHILSFRNNLLCFLDGGLVSYPAAGRMAFIM